MTRVRPLVFVAALFIGSVGLTTLPGGLIGVSATIAAAQQQPPAADQPARGRGRGMMSPPQNLQVLPKDIAIPDLQATMRGFTQALGVRCNHCHVQEGRGGRNDMAADEKPAKATARVMLRMVHDINETLAANLGKPAADVVKVECATCHRGAAIPALSAPAAP